MTRAWTRIYMAAVLFAALEVLVILQVPGWLS